MDVFSQLQALLTRHQARYRLIEHAAAGKSVEVAAIRGTAVSQGAKALVCRVKISSNQRRNVLAVFPADRQADLDAIARAAGGKKASLASQDLARELTGCEIGAIPPFSFNPELHLLVDPRCASGTMKSCSTPAVWTPPSCSTRKTTSGWPRRGRAAHQD